MVSLYGFPPPYLFSFHSLLPTSLLPIYSSITASSLHLSSTLFILLSQPPPYISPPPYLFFYHSLLPTPLLPIYPPITASSLQVSLLHKSYLFYIHYFFYLPLSSTLFVLESQPPPYIFLFMDSIYSPITAFYMHLSSIGSYFLSYHIIFPKYLSLFSIPSIILLTFFSLARRKKFPVPHGEQ